MGDDADDVILEGSPLFEYLKEMCPDEEFETVPPQNRQDNGKSSDLPKKTNNGFIDKAILGLRSLHSLWKMLWVWPIFELEEIEMNQKMLCQLNALSRIAQSRLLNEADCAFLRSLETHLKDTEPSTHAAVSSLYIIASSVLFLGASTCFLVPHVLNPRELIVDSSRDIFLFPVLSRDIFLFPVSSRDLFEVVLGGLLCIVSVCVFIRGFCHRRLVRIFNVQIKELNRYTGQEELFQKSFRRSLQYLQEVEVLARGYTMVNGASYSGNNEISQLQLLPLRKVCLSVITKHLITLRAGTKHLLTTFPVLPEYRLSDESISHQKLPDWIESSAVNDQRIHHPHEAEVYNLSTLKILFGLYKEQCSDFARQLVISMIYSDELSLVQKTDLRQLKKWLEILKGCSDECEESMHRLTQTYKIHRWSPAPDQRTESNSFSRREIWRPEIQLVTALHSLRLHLETVLARISPVDDDLTENYAVSINKSKVIDIQALLHEIGDHLQASQMCYQEANASVDKLTNTKKTHVSIDEDALPPEAEPHDQAVSIRLITDDSDQEDSDIDEQIFEAYIDVKKKVHEDEDSEEWLQERIQRRREAEDAKRLLQELNCVLTKRSEQKEKSKREKLLKKISKSQKTLEEPQPSITTTESYDSSRVEPLNPEQGDVQCMDGSMFRAPAGEINDIVLDEPMGGDDICQGSVEALDAVISSNEKESAICDVGFEAMNVNTSTLHSRHGERYSGLLEANQSRSSYLVDGQSISAGMEKDVQLERTPAGSGDRKFTSDMDNGIQILGNDLAKDQRNGDTLQSLQLNSHENTYTTMVTGTEKFNLNEEEEEEGRSYECDGRTNESRDQSEDRTTYLTVNPWMVPGLAAQVAKISQQRVNLSEDTFGEDDSDDDA